MEERRDDPESDPGKSEDRDREEESSEQREANESDKVDEESEQSFPASDPPAW